MKELKEKYDRWDIYIKSPAARNILDILEGAETAEAASVLIAVLDFIENRSIVPSIPLEGYRSPIGKELISIEDLKKPSY